MAVGLTSNWKLPVAYYVVDHLPGAIQAVIVKQLISILTEARLVVLGIVCANLLGCSVTTGGQRNYLTHPKHEWNGKLHFWCLPSFHIGSEFLCNIWNNLLPGTTNNMVIHRETGRNSTKWQFEQTEQTEVSDAIDFSRDDLHLPQFPGSEKSIEFIRMMDKLFDFMHSRSLVLKAISSLWVYPTILPDEHSWWNREVLGCTQRYRGRPID